MLRYAYIACAITAPSMTIVVTAGMVTTITTAYCDSTAAADTIANTTAATSVLTFRPLMSSIVDVPHR